MFETRAYFDDDGMPKKKSDQQEQEQEPKPVKEEETMPDLIDTSSFGVKRVQFKPPHTRKYDVCKYQDKVWCRLVRDVGKVGLGKKLEQDWQLSTEQDLSKLKIHRKIQYDAKDGPKNEFAAKELKSDSKKKRVAKKQNSLALLL